MQVSRMPKSYSRRSRSRARSMTLPHELQQHIEALEQGSKGEKLVLTSTPATRSRAYCAMRWRTGMRWSRRYTGGFILSGCGSGSSGTPRPRRGHDLRDVRLGLVRAAVHQRSAQVERLVVLATIAGQASIGSLTQLDPNQHRL